MAPAPFTSRRRSALAILSGLLLSTAPAAAQSRQLELGLEGFAYESRSSALNRDNQLGLDRHPGLGRLTLGWKQAHGGFRAAARGYLERTWGEARDDTRFVLRQGYAQYWWGERFGVRAGKQRIAWGSGLAWNPTNRLEPPKNALNTTLEQEGALAVRLDWAPRPEASLILVAASTDAQPRDLPLAGTQTRRRSLAARGRLLVADTDLSLTVCGGENQRTLLGLDLARDLGGLATLHLEAAVYRGAELLPVRGPHTTQARLVVGALRTSGEHALAFEYFYNGEGLSDAGAGHWHASLERAWSAATDPSSPPETQAQALADYAGLASAPFGWGLGLRRHYLHASWTRGGATSTWTGALRTVVGLDDRAWALTPGLGWAPRGDLTFNLDAVLLLGPPDSEYRLTPVRGALQARARWLF